MKILVSPSLTKFAERACKTLKLAPWEGIYDPDKDVLFFGLYSERDYDVFNNFDGKKSVFWCGGDIIRMMQDYERKRILRNSPETKHYCENEIQQAELKANGFDAEIVYSFLDDPDKYVPQFKEGAKKVWMCSNREREDEYGIPLMRRMAGLFPDIEFHIYGVDREAPGKPYYKEDYYPNVFYHGSVPETQFNEEIKNYHCGFRPNLHDGNSEVAMKSIFLGQYPITRISYPDIWTYENEGQLKECFEKLKKQTLPNHAARNAWLARVNTFSWLK
jgi:hypothetical protein